MSNNGKKVSPKISKIILTIGITILVIGIVLIILGIVQQNELKQAYDEWHQKWFYEHTATLNEKPSQVSVVLIVGIFVSVISFVPIFMGATPFIAKTAFKLQKETLDYAGEDMTAVGMKGIDVAKPVVKKGVDEIIAPSVGAIVNSIKDPNASEKICPNCGDKMDSDEEYCSNCGQKLKNQCPQCGCLNSAKNKFCKKCGNKLQ